MEGPSSGRTHDDGDYDLKLDPGVPARRNHSSGCKFILLIIVTTLGLFTAIFVGLRFVNMFHHMREPHDALLYKNKSVDPVDPAMVVRPLIDAKQKFDIVATVWLRKNDSSSGSAISTLPAEEAIFTGTVFQGLTLKDKDIHKTVKYTVPTEILYVFFCPTSHLLYISSSSKNRDLKHYHLRASFVLIPTSPSLLDNLTNYSSWRNEVIPFPPSRPWPYVSTLFEK